MARTGRAGHTPQSAMQLSRTVPFLVVPFLVLLLVVAGCDDGGSGGDRRGQACIADADCGALVCALSADAEPEDLEPAPLVCGDLQDAQSLGAACEDASDCDHGLCLLAGGCALPCADEDDCGPLERCTEVFTRTSADSLQSLTACVRRIEARDDVEVSVDTRADPLTAGGNVVALEPIPDARTFVILEHSDRSWPGTRCAPPLCLLSLLADEGGSLYDATADYAVDAPPRLAIATGGHVDPLVLRLPTTGERGAARRYIAALQTEQPGELTVTTVALASDAERGQALDLHVFYVGPLPFSPSGDRGPPVLAAALDEVDAILGQAGIFIGSVHQVAVQGELPMRGTYFAQDGGPWMGFTMLHIRYGALVELPGLFRLSAGAPGGGVSLFLLDDIDAVVPGAESYAEAGGIPGPPSMHGTGGSGIAFAASMMVDDPQAFGRTLAHELAHYLGLFHTSEQDGRVLEGLDDTPACRLEQDADGDGLDVADCAEHGASNLMFWAKSTATELTAEQRAVLADSPILR